MDQFNAINQRKLERNRTEVQGYTMEEQVENLKKGQEKSAEKPKEQSDEQSQVQSEKVKEKKAPAEKVEDKTRTELTTKKRPVIPKEKKNLSVAKTLVLDESIVTKLQAFVNVLRNSGVVIDKKPISDSSFTRMALLHEFERVFELNGEDFKEEIEKELTRSPEVPTKTFKC